MKTLTSRRVLLGVTGGVAAYKTVDLVRRLKDAGAAVTVVMTEAAARFITPLSLETASGNKVYTSLWDEPLAHIRLPAEADLMIIAPATANIIGKLANGIADDLLSTCYLSFRGPVVIAPAMNWRMYEHFSVQENLRRLSTAGVIRTGPERGSLACGEEGVGRMSETASILETAASALTAKDLAGKRIVVTAGPTREYLDPVRFISNRSSGKMGYALARAAHNRGAEVTLISGPSPLPRPDGVFFVAVETAAEMFDAVQKAVPDADILVMAAAVADFAPAARAEAKTDKAALATLQLKPTADIISSVTSADKAPFVIGFAAETGQDLARAKNKMLAKRMDMIVFNDVTEPGAGFDTDTNSVVIIDRSGEKRSGLLSKDAVANLIYDRFVDSGA